MFDFLRSSNHFPSRYMWSEPASRDFDSSFGNPCDAKDQKGEKLFSNQCAIRLSYAMKKSGINFNSFPKGRKCWVLPTDEHILSAVELADWIQKSKIPDILIVENITGDKWREKILSRTGIICFEDYYSLHSVVHHLYVCVSRVGVCNRVYSDDARLFLIWFWVRSATKF